MLGLSILAFPVVLILQIPQFDRDLTINVRGIANSNGTQTLGSDAPSGQFANVRGLQFVTDFVLTFAIAVCLQNLIDAFRKRFSPVHFRDLKAPVLREFCEFAPTAATLEDPISQFGAVFETDGGGGDNDDNADLVEHFQNRHSKRQAKPQQVWGGSMVEMPAITSVDDDGINSASSFRS